MKPAASRLKALFPGAILLFALLPVLQAGEPPCVWEGVDRIVAVGDLHGDYEGFVKILRGTGVLDKKLCLGRRESPSRPDRGHHGPGSGSQEDLRPPPEAGKGGRPGGRNGSRAPGQPRGAQHHRHRLRLSRLCDGRAVRLLPPQDLPPGKGKRASQEHPRRLHPQAPGGGGRGDEAASRRVLDEAHEDGRRAQGLHRRIQRHLRPLASRKERRHPDQ